MTGEYLTFSTQYSSYTYQDEKVKFDKLPVGKSSHSFLLGDYFPLPYNLFREKAILKYLEVDAPSHQVLNSVTDLSPEEKTQLSYLLLSLDSYYQQKISVIRRRQLIYLLMTESGLKTLKRIRLKSFLESNSGRLCSIPDWYDSVPHWSIYDIGEVFNYNYGMFWEAEDTKDYLLSKLPVSLEGSIVKIFRETCERLISKAIDFEEVLPVEILLRVNSSKSIDEYMTSKPNYSLKSSNLRFSAKRSEGKRVLITTGPGQGRDAIINKVEDLNTIQLINENIRNFLKVNFKEFLLQGTYDDMYKKYVRKCNKSSHFFCRDIQKEGLTKPKYLCKMVLSALRKRYPDCVAFQFPSFYSGPWFEDDKGERGHGLGMANELTTLIQIILFFTVNYYLGEEGSYTASSSAFFLNDDAVVFINGTEENLDDFVNADFEVCEGLGILVQKDKSFQSDSCAVFCEMYYARNKPYLNDKESYKLRELNIISKCTNILEAKFYAGNMKGSLSFIEDILKKTYINLGYEFNKEEINWPMTLGGLRPFKLRGVDFTLKYVEEYPDLRILWKAYQANQERRLRSWNKLLKEYVPPIAVLYPQILYEKNERILDRIGLCSESGLSSIFFRPTKEHKFYRSLEKLAMRRRVIFENTTTFPTYETFTETYVSENLSNVAINESFIERFIKVKMVSCKNFKDPYMITNPIACYINFLNNDNPNIPRTQWGLFQQNCILSAEKSVFTRMRAQNTLSLIDRFEEDFEPSIIVFPEDENDIQDFMESYPKPFLTYELIKEGNLLPIPKPKFRNPDLISRKEVYGRYLNCREVFLSQSRTWQRMRIILKFEECFKDMIEFDNDFWEVVEQRARDRSDQSDLSKMTDQTENNDAFFASIVKFDTSSVKIEHQELQKFATPVPSRESPESSSEEFQMDAQDEIIEENVSRYAGNMFFKENGDLPLGGIEVYGSKEWLLWFFDQSPVNQDLILEQDPELALACVDTFEFQRGVRPGSDAFKEKNEVLLNNMTFSSNLSWVAHVFVNDFMGQEVEDEPLEVDIFN